MGNPTDGLTGAVGQSRSSFFSSFWKGVEEPLLKYVIQVVAVYIAGEAVGALTQTFLGDKLGRIRFMEFMCIVVTIGTVIQTASVNIGMFLAGRVLAGFSVGCATTRLVLLFRSAAGSLIGGNLQWNGGNSPDLS